MDSLTHTVLGACTGELIAGRRIGKKAMLIGALANNIPDLDMVSVLWTSEAKGLLTHRGITHSFLFAVIMLPFLIFLFRKLFRRVELTTPYWIVLVGHGLLLHIIMDSFTTYGTGWWEPFSHERVSFNLLFILDPVILLVFMIGCITLLIMPAGLRGRTTVASTFLLIGLSYLVTVASIKLIVNKKIEAYMQEKKIRPLNYMFSPTPLNCIMWYINLQVEDAFLVGYYSIFDRQPIELSKHAMNKHLLSPVRGNEDVQYLERFTRGYYAMQQRHDTLLLYDTRFGQISADPASPFFFGFYILKNGEEIKVKQAEFRKMQKGDLAKLYQRVKGN